MIGLPPPPCPPLPQMRAPHNMRSLQSGRVLKKHGLTTPCCFYIMEQCRRLGLSWSKMVTRMVNCSKCCANNLSSREPFVVARGLFESFTLTAHHTNIPQQNAAAPHAHACWTGGHQTSDLLESWGPQPRMVSHKQGWGLTMPRDASQQQIHHGQRVHWATPTAAVHQARPWQPSGAGLVRGREGSQQPGSAGPPALRPQAATATAA